MRYFMALIVAMQVQPAVSPEPWTPGFIGFRERERLVRLQNDISNADMEVTINGRDKVDIGVVSVADDAQTPVTFTFGELQGFFSKQRHKKFIVVTYEKNAPSGDLKDSIKGIREYFVSAGYERILFLHGHSSGVVVHEDHRANRTEAEGRGGGPPK